jgi:two-component system, NarL family, nitrate/nitrite response regulator NarL
MQTRNTPVSEPIRLFVIDDHSLFREGLLRLLDTDAELVVVGNAASAGAALEQLATCTVDVLILDYDLGDQTALHVVRELKKQGFAGRCLVVTAGLPDHDALELIRLGVYGIFHKKHSPDELHRSIREVAQGKILIDQTYLRDLVASVTIPEEPTMQLTERDRSILRLLLEGVSNKEIAATMNLSESAVKAALQQLFAKTGVRTRSQLVRVALEKLGSQL